MGVGIIAPGVVLDPEGYWTEPNRVHLKTSYPSDGHAFCSSIESQSFWFSHRNRIITASMQSFPPGEGPFVDLGAGNGVVAAALQDAGFDTIAVEPDLAGARNAVRRGVRTVICGEFPSRAFSPAAAGGIGLFDVLEHVEEDVEFLRSLRPYLRDEGRIYLTVPALPMLWSPSDEASGHFRRYTARSLSQALTSAGFRVEYCSYFFSLLPPAIYLLRVCAGRFGKRTQRSRVYHTAGGSLLRRLAAAAHDFEWRRVSRGKRVSIGASCLLVARKD